MGDAFEVKDLRGRTSGVKYLWVITSGGFAGVLNVALGGP